MKVNHFLIPYLAALVFIFGSIAGSEGVAWYQSLVLPSWAPSEGLIAFIWALIYVCISYAALIIWNQDHRDRRFKAAMVLFALSGAANLLWSVVFFALHDFLASAAAALVLAAFLVSISVLYWKRSKKAALLILPFIVWVLFAAYFNYVLGLLNP
jgi:translocator protein